MCIPLLAKAEDQEVVPLLQQALDLSIKITREIQDVYTQEKHPFPIGFTDDDVNTEVPRLFTDTFALLYI